jgi:hypothetical protein
MGILAKTAQRRRFENTGQLLAFCARCWRATAARGSTRGTTHPAAGTTASESETVAA